VAARLVFLPPGPVRVQVRDQVYTVAISPDNRLLAAGGGEVEVVLLHPEADALQAEEGGVALVVAAVEPGGKGTLTELGGCTGFFEKNGMLSGQMNELSYHHMND
jgi:hypothetical protein